MSAVIHSEWYNTNEARAYPLDDLATQVGDDGVGLPENIIADLNLRLPDSIANRAFLSGATSTEHLVTLTFSADTGGAYTALAAVTVSKPVTVYRNYALTALTPGVAGWVVFGHGVEEHTDLAVRCSLETQGLLAARAARAYDSMPVTSLGVYGTGLELTGLVNIETSGDLLLEEVQREIDGVCTDVLLLRIDADVDATLLSDYAGPCGKRPGTGTCPDIPIKRINGVTPDCFGDVSLTIAYPVLPYTVQCNDYGEIDGVIILDLPFGLGDVCPIPREVGGTDLCDGVVPAMLEDFDIEDIGNILLNGFGPGETP